MKPEKTFKRSAIFFLYDLLFFVLFYPSEFKFLSFFVFLIACIHLSKYIGTKLTIGNLFVSLNSGILSSSSQDIPFNKISSVSTKQGLLGRIFNYGDVGIFTGNDEHGIWINNVQTPKSIKDEINARSVDKA